jgi:hypothetical protein
MRAITKYSLIKVDFELGVVGGKRFASFRDAQATLYDTLMEAVRERDWCVDAADLDESKEAFLIVPITILEN